ncbi:MAG: hypothetical protein ACK4MD_03690 [Demequina sp.]
MADDVSVTPSALDTDAETWREWAQTVKTAGEAVPTVGADLTALDFSILPGAQDVAQAYATAASTLAQDLSSGAAAMEAAADKLEGVRRIYETTEQETLDAIEAALANQMEGS